MRRRDGAPAYALASVVDDAASGVTRIVRGRDLLSLTPLQDALRGAGFENVRLHPAELSRIREIAEVELPERTVRSLIVEAIRRASPD